MPPKFRARNRLLLITAFALATLYSAKAQNAFSPGGGDYTIAGNLAGDQTAPQAAFDVNGGVLVWQDNAVGNQGLGVRAIRLSGGLNRTGPLFRVNSSVLGEHEKPQVALLQNGNAVIVWQGGVPGFQKIYARILGGSGTNFVTGDILVNTYTNNYQINPAVTVLADGSVVVVWASAGQDGSYQGIFGQRLTASGTKLGSEFQINQYTQNNQRTPSLAALSGGGFVVAWVSELQRGPSSVDIYARRFDGSGNPLSNEFAANATSTNVCANPSVAASPNGGFAVAWSQKDGAVYAVENQGSGVPAAPSSTNGWDVYARLFSNAGIAMGPSLRLNTETYGDQFAPRIAAFGKNYLAVWISLGQDSSREGIFGQFLSADGSLAGVEFQVNTLAASRQIHPSLATDGANRFLTLWTSYVGGYSFDLFARWYDLIRATLVATPQGLAVSWNTIPGCVYQVQVSSTVGGSSWNNVGPARIASATSDSLTVSATPGAGYYRVVRIQ